MPDFVKAILIGAGNRGADAYGPYALQHPDRLKFVAVAEPDPLRREFFANQHNISLEFQFDTWKALFEKHRSPLGNAALICTQDWMHTGPTLAALRAGYHVLLEKPMANTLDECLLLVKESERLGKQLHICHVLRYTPHFQKMRSIIQSGDLGQLITVDHRENVAYYHMAHSYVRGHWRDSNESSPMILAKCCHDLDILIWLLDSKCETLSSVGGLAHFRPENAPDGATRYCLDGCPERDTCPYYAPFIYVEGAPLLRAIKDNGKGSMKWLANFQEKSPSVAKFLGRVIPQIRQWTEYRGWPRSVVCPDPTPDNLLRALKTSPFGRCVYQCDNNVVDHQLVSMWFEKDLSVNLTMQGHSHLEGRTTRIQGSHAELQAFFGIGGSWIDVFEHRSGRHTHYDTHKPMASGHGGGDFALMDAFIHSILNSDGGTSTSAHEALESHLMAFAAEYSRVNERSIQMSEFR